MDSPQIQGELNLAKFLIVGGIWLLIVGAVALVVSRIDHQWMPPNDVLYQKDANNHFVKDANNNYVLKANFNREAQCEKLNFKPGTLAGAVLEPENTWSNAFYLLAGMLILVCTKRPLGYLLGVQLCALAVLSGAYHATLQENLQMLDVAGIYFVLTALLFYCLQAAFVHGWSKNAEWVLTAVLSSVSVSGGLFMAHNRNNFYGFFGSTTVAFTVVCALIVLVVYEMGRQGFDWKPSGESHGTSFYFWPFVLIGIPGIAVRLLDGDKHKLCLPKNPFQAHAIWHTFGAATLLLGYDLFAWSRGRERDYAVFPRKPPTGGRINRYTLQSTALTALVVGLVLLSLSIFAPGAFVDDSQPVLTGITIASFFIVTGITLLILRGLDVIKDPTSDN